MVYPKSTEEFEKVYRKEYRGELDSCDDWIKWCKEHDDYYGVNFHQGRRSSIIFNNHKMEQLLRIFKKEAPNV